MLFTVFQNMNCKFQKLTLIRMINFKKGIKKTEKGNRTVKKVTIDCKLECIFSATDGNFYT